MGPCICDLGEIHVRRRIVSVALRPTQEFQGPVRKFFFFFFFTKGGSFKWSVIYKNIELLCSTSETNIVNQLNFN